MTQLTSTEFKAQTAALYADNTAGDISAGDLRTQMDNVADSSVFKLTGQTTNPVANDDGVNTSGNGVFKVGDVWVNETADLVYMCANNATGAAVWIQTTLLSDTQVKTAYENNANTNAYTDAELAKVGFLTVTGAIDLDAIEAGATTDQTGAEIKTAYELEANAFTDAQFTKLGAIEALADVTDTANVDAAGAVMDTDVLLINAQTGTAFTLGLVDRKALVTMSNAAANVVTIPTNAAIALPIGSTITVAQIGAGATSITGDTGVTLNGVSAGSGAIVAQWDEVTLYKSATNTWYVTGDIGAVV